jgi:hypothetical protein
MDLKQWQCKNKHALGVIRMNGSGTPQLMLYRHAVDLSADEPAPVDVMIGPLVGQMPVQCDICGDVQLWSVTVDAVAGLIFGLSEDQLEKLQARLVKANLERTRKIRSRARFE